MSLRRFIPSLVRNAATDARHSAGTAARRSAEMAARYGAATDELCSGRCSAAMDARRTTRQSIVFVVAFTFALFGPVIYNIAREEATEESGPHGGPPDNSDGTLASKNN